MYYIVYLALSVATSVSVDVLDNTDDEWIAPGYSLSEDILINPFDYVTNIENHPKNIACHAFFVDTEDGEMWRVIMVGSNRMVILQENWENPMVVDFPFDAYGAVYSRGGRFVIIRDGKENSNDEALHIDIDNNIVRSFDPTPDGQQCGLFLSDNGTVAGMGRDLIVDFNQDLSTATVRHYDETNLRFHCTSAYDEIIVAENVYRRPREIVAFDWDGNELWTVNTGDRAIFNPLAVSLDGRKIGTSFYQGSGAMILNGNDGSMHWEGYLGKNTLRIVFSPDASCFALPASFSSNAPPNNIVVISFNEDESYKVRNWYSASSLWGAFVPNFIDQDRILFSAFKSGSTQFRYCLCISGELIWASESIKSDECSFLSIGNDFNLDHDLRCPVSILSNSHMQVIYHSQEGLRILTIEDDVME